MRLRRPPAQAQHEAPPDPPPSLISLRALVLIILALGAGVLVFFHPAVGFAIGAGVAVLTVLDKVTGS